ncbi:RNA-directed DNA polymerase, eukaryota, reverse transcriptase zinc-binding domain protein [Tanacetum coccineum]
MNEGDGTKKPFVAHAPTVKASSIGKLGFMDIVIKYMGELWVMMEFKSVDSMSKFRECVSVMSWFSQIMDASNEFEVEDKWGKLLDVDDQDETCFHSKRLCVYTKSGKSIREDFKVIHRVVGQKVGDTDDHCDEERVPDSIFENEDLVKSYVEGGSMIGLLEKVVKVGQVMGFKMEGCISNMEEIIGSQGVEEAIQETKMEKIDEFCVKQCWGNLVFDYAYSEAVGNSGESKEKQSLWDFLHHEIGKWNGDVIIMGDFNESDEVNFELSNYKYSVWNKNNMGLLGNEQTLLKKKLEDIDLNIDSGLGNDDLINSRLETIHQLQKLDSLESMERAQKVKIKWAVEGDENTGFFHEIKKAVWECGIDKAPGPDVFTFGFFRHFWYLVDMKVLRRLVVDEGMYQGIKVGGLINLSHMFYADDAVFVGEWSESNISSLIHVLDCFHKVSGLKINMSKSKLMGIEVEAGLQSWEDIVDRVRRRLSKWKMKMLSIGGRLTLIKSVLGSMPIFHMSMFKVPTGILRILESIRGKFFNGHETYCKKASWVQWNKVLAPKVIGGLGISSLYALNRGLLFKWVWRIPRGGLEESQVEELSKVVQMVELNNSQDKWSWSLNTVGEYTVASARYLIDVRLLPKGELKTRWIRYVPIKVNTFAWKVMTNSIPTRFNISRRGIDIESLACVNCDVGIGIYDHFFSLPV